MGGGGGVRYGYSLEIADYFPYCWLINDNNKSKKTHKTKQQDVLAFLDFDISH